MKVHPLGGITAYQVFGISLDFDQELLDAMHKQMVRRHHPDKGGDPAAFLQYQVAYEILSDPAQRLEEKAREQKRLSETYGQATIPTLNTPPPIPRGPKNYRFKSTPGVYTIYDTRVRGRVFHAIMLTLAFTLNAWLFLTGGGDFGYHFLVLSVGLATVMATFPWSFMAARYLASKRGGFIVLAAFYGIGVFALISSFTYGLAAAVFVFVGLKVYGAASADRAPAA